MCVSEQTNKKSDKKVMDFFKKAQSHEKVCLCRPFKHLYIYIYIYRKVTRKCQHVGSKERPPNPYTLTLLFFVGAAIELRIDPTHIYIYIYVLDQSVALLQRQQKKGASMYKDLGVSL